MPRRVVDRFGLHVERIAEQARAQPERDDDRHVEQHQEQPPNDVPDELPEFLPVFPDGRKEGFNCLHRCLNSVCAYLIPVPIIHIDRKVATFLMDDTCSRHVRSGECETQIVANSSDGLCWFRYLPLFRHHVFAYDEIGRDEITSLMEVKIVSASSVTKQAYVAASSLCDCDNPWLRMKAEEIIDGAATPEEMALKVFYSTLSIFEQGAGAD